MFKDLLISTLYTVYSFRQDSVDSAVQVHQEDHVKKSMSGAILLFSMPLDNARGSRDFGNKTVKNQCACTSAGWSNASRHIQCYKLPYKFDKVLCLDSSI